MNPGLHEFISQDLPAMLTATLAVVACALLGNFLVLRRMSLMGDAISHSVLPGLVAGFLIAGTRGRAAMFLGAAGAGALTVVLVELVRKLGRLEAGAAMGAVFAVMFALGVLLIEQVAARGIDLDPDCVFNGQLEHVFWFPPSDWGRFWTLRTFFGVDGIPRELWTTGAVALLAAAFVVAFFKELRITSFDPALATSLGIRASWMHFALMLLVAAAVVASFEAVGSILVIGMLICPPATARLLTDRLATQVWLSVAIATLVGVGGYALAGWAPVWAGTARALNAAGVMIVVSGVLLAGAILAGPRYGVIARAMRRRRLAAEIAVEDLLGLLYRAQEAGRAVTAGELATPRGRPGAVKAALAAGQVARREGRLVLTDSGRERATVLIRAHRLWESYLVREAGIRPDHVHETAGALEHITGPALSEGLVRRSGAARDPHGREIPR